MISGRDMQWFFPTLYYENLNSDKLLIFLPSARPTDVYPYYPRISWCEYFAQYSCVLYVGDPFQNRSAYIEAGGSWFINEHGVSVLPEIGRIIGDYVNERYLKKVIFYGSSMGGYAGIILASYMEGSVCYAECPQIFLDKHPDSLNIMNKVCNHDAIARLPTPIHCIRNSLFAFEVNIVLSIYDSHYQAHIIPFIEELSRVDIKPVVRVSLYANSAYSKGHVALSFEDAKSMLSGIIF